MLIVLFVAFSYRDIKMRVIFSLLVLPALIIFQTQTSDTKCNICSFTTDLILKKILHIKEKTTESVKLN